MTRQHHHLKIEALYFQAIEEGIKTFECRKNNRNYRKGDIVSFIEKANGIETGKELGPYEIIYIQRGPLFGIQEGYCVFSIKKVKLTKCKKCGKEPQLLEWTPPDTDQKFWVIECCTTLYWQSSLEKAIKQWEEENS